MIRNLTKNTTISKNKSSKLGVSKVIGLMGKENIEPVFFETRLGIHTFLVKKPISVVILDDEFRVVVIKKKLEPNRVFFWSLRYKNVLELDPNDLESSKTQVGDRLSIL